MPDLTMTPRAKALIEHIDGLSPNLLRAYVVDMIEGAPDIEVEKMIVVFRAQNAVQERKP